ncbi:MAG: hypothetical protein PF541_03835 [Prolixibacteraceae bacterium]|jgi:hypothetical protein|nr:hypothetical protein [Prolixibacteraceae bacterium]
MKKVNIIITSIILLLSANILNAQTDSTLNKEVEVIKAYQPSISDAYKIGTNPRINDTLNYTPSFEYRIYSKDIPVEKTINHLPVVQLGNPPRTKSNLGYVKGALGNAWTPYGELYINTTPSKKTDFGLQMKHFSSRPSVLLNNGLKMKAPNSNNLARVFMKNYFRKSILDWEIKYNRDRINYYGFPGTDTLSYRQTEANSTTLNSKQALNNATAKMKLINTNNRAKLGYTINLGYNYFWNATTQTAHEANYKGLFSKKERKYTIALSTVFDYYYQNNVVNNIDNTLLNHQFYNVEITPTISFSKEFFDLTAGFNLGTIIGADSTLLWNISPNIYFAYHPIKGIMSLFAGADGGFSANSYKQSALKNPYINYNTELKPSEEVIRIYGGIKGKISRKLSYLFDVNYAINQNEAFFFLEEEKSSQGSIVDNLFSVEYDDINLLKLGGNIRYSSNDFSLNLQGNYYVYDAKNLTILSHMPDFDISLNSTFKITKQISSTIGFNYIGARVAKYKLSDYTSNPTLPIITESANKLDQIIDLNLAVNYRYSQKVNFFLDASNILNQKYEVWNGYNQQGLLILIGGSYTF